MNQDDEWSKPYRKIKAAEDLIQENTLLDDYVRLYKKKFRGEPLVGVSRIHQAQIKHLVAISGDKAHHLLEHYFTMKDEWFIKQAYSLDCLIKNIHKVSADFSQRITRHKDSGKISIATTCDSCWKPFVLVCDLHFNYYDRPSRCPECEKENKPIRYASAAEKKRLTNKIGASFPEMPIDSATDSIKNT